MIEKEIKDEINLAIKSIWKDIEKDYNKCLIPNEGTFVNAFYHHLREKIKHLEKDNIRIFTEFPLNFTNEHYRADMAVVKIGKNEFDVEYEDIIAIIEFKLKWYKAGYIKISEDFNKIKEYIKKSELNNCHFYVASICYRNYNETFFLPRKFGRITEMTAFENEDGEMIFKQVR